MNTKSLKIIATAGFIALLTLQETKAQDGMDRAGIGIGRYARLHRATLPFLENTQNEKAMGVYTEDQLPSSTLEINTTTTYLPFLHPNLAGDRGLVFRSVAPAGFTQQWQMFTGTSATAQTERFKLFVPANDSCVIIKSTTSHLILADSKTQISVEELKKMQEQIASLKQQVATLQKQLDELKK